MGGNVFPGVTSRYSKTEYEYLVEQLNDTKFPALFEKYHVPPALSTKESYGDLDVLCIPVSPLDERRLKDWFNTNYAKKNGDCWSVAFEGLPGKYFQLDIIVTNHEEFNFYANYLGKSDRGNFVGKLAHSLGCKFGHDGLWLPVRLSDDHVLGSICLTRNVREAEDFLDVKPLEKVEVFEDVFENVAASKYFNPESYKLENNNAVARVRDKKRPSYHLFLALCDLYKQENPNRVYFTRVKDKSEHLPTVFAAFPHAKVQYDELMVKKAKLEEYRSKFNGDLVKEYTGLENKELGEFMRKFKEEYSQDDILEMSHYRIMLAITNFK
jgi:hypothetical protein